ncbi:heme lyase CcmF/NrfE family subunit [Magnetofaba australis]|uniref:Putative cytochrome C assembly protein n=1 Tax=Magnetofaba australis IT-1 TaxID=1434232 RepID=A0A1Y2K1H1_9PROT|nr:heme lyase CcmF/NrfE family subunit [Magnetofaba australis]OSM01476.1 putative cytochrome C assembly protein [Magnetofaba australis IT-1]
MLIEIGHFAAIVAFVLTFVQIAAPIAGAKLERPAWIRVGRHAAFLVFGLLTVASLSLVYAFVEHDFSVRYVATNSSRNTPLMYLITGMWGGHEGSLLLWGWLLSMFVAVAAWIHWRPHPRSIPWVLSILGAVVCGFLMLVLFLSSPFERLIPAAPMGRDLNPLLQDPGMAFHPPFLYLGYVGFAVPYAFAMAALITGSSREEWILATRRWTLFAWAMLTTGIVFGAYWAYYELGWGGYWAWDPVENASFMPWLTGTAFLHSIMVQERRRMFKTWNLFLIITTFALSLLGTFLVRSGVLSSVHAFASDPGRGVFILIFMAVMLLFSFGLLAFRSDHLKSDVRMQGLLCKENAFLFNNLFLLVATVTVLLGTLFPLAVETFTDDKVTVGPPYFNKVFIPLMLGLLFLMAIGPLIAWRKANQRDLKHNFMIPGVLGAMAIPVGWFIGVDHPYGLLTVGLGVFVFATHFWDVYRGVMVRVRQGQGNPLLALGKMLLRNRRRYGGFIVHLGILVMCAGFIGTGLFQTEKTVMMRPGDSMQVGPWTLDFKSIGNARGPNWSAEEALIEAKKGDLTLMLHPQQRKYDRHSMTTTEAAIENFLFEDLYVILNDPVPGTDKFAIRAYRNPLVGWIWAGSLIMAFGAIVSMTQGRRLARKTKAA